MAGAAFGKLIELLDHARRIDHHARADDAGDARRQDAAGQQRELVDLVADDDRVPGVCAALIADDEVVLAGKEVDDLAFGFVAPLQTDNASAGHNGKFADVRKRVGCAVTQNRSHALILEWSLGSRKATGLVTIEQSHKIPGVKMVIPEKDEESANRHRR